MKKASLLFTVILLYTVSMAQDNGQKNLININGGIILSNYSQMDDWLSYGFNLGYSRFITKKLYADIAVGKGRFKETATGLHALREDEMSSTFNLSTYNFGLGYNFVDKDKIKLGGQLSYYHYRYYRVLETFSDGQGNIISRKAGTTGQSNIIPGLRVTNILGEHTAIVTNLGYSLFAPRVDRLILNTGISFTF